MLRYMLRPHVYGRRRLTEFAELVVLQLEVVGPEPLARDPRTLSPQSAPAVVRLREARVGAQTQVRDARVLDVGAAAAARLRTGDVAEPVRREEADADREEREEHRQRRQDEQTVLRHHVLRVDSGRARAPASR